MNNEWYEKDFTHKYSHASWSRVLFVSVSDVVFGLDSPQSLQIKISDNLLYYENVIWYLVKQWDD